MTWIWILIFFLVEYKSLHTVAHPVQTSHPSCFWACDDIAVSHWSQEHIMLVCGLEKTSQGHDLPIGPPLIAAPHDQSSAASNTPLQLHIHWLPIYTRLLIATLINFTGRQSNKALLWGLRQMCGVTFNGFFFWCFFLKIQTDPSLPDQDLKSRGEREGENGEKKKVCKDS